MENSTTGTRNFVCIFASTKELFLKYYSFCINTLMYNRMDDIETGRLAGGAPRVCGLYLCVAVQAGIRISRRNRAGVERSDACSLNIVYPQLRRRCRIDGYHRARVERIRGNLYYIICRNIRLNQVFLVIQPALGQAHRFLWTAVVHDNLVSDQFYHRHAQGQPEQLALIVPIHGAQQGRPVLLVPFDARARPFKTLGRTLPGLPSTLGHLCKMVRVKNVANSRIHALGVVCQTGIAFMVAAVASAAFSAVKHGWIKNKKKTSTTPVSLGAIVVQAPAMIVGCHNTFDLRVVDKCQTAYVPGLPEAPV